MLQRQKSPPQRQRDRMRAVICAQLGQDGAHVRLHGFFGNRQFAARCACWSCPLRRSAALRFRRSLSMASPMCAASSIAISDGTWRKPACTARIASSSSLRMLLLSRKPGGAGLQRAADLRIAFIGGQHQHAGMGEIAANRLQRRDAAHVRHRDIHDGDVGTASGIRTDRGVPVARFAGQLHVRLRRDGFRQAGAQHRVVIDHQYADRGDGSHGIKRAHAIPPAGAVENVRNIARHCLAGNNTLGSSPIRGSTPTSGIHR